MPYQKTKPIQADGFCFFGGRYPLQAIYRLRKERWQNKRKNRLFSQAVWWTI
jgi:hypothetical protein